MIRRIGPIGLIGMIGYRTMATLIHERVKLARAGENPCVICRVRSGWVVLGDHQFFKGYSLLPPDPVVSSLKDLTPAERAQFLTDMDADEALLTQA